MSNLAEHHYLVTFMAWQLAEWLNKRGSKLDIGKVLKYCLVHDLGELLGGDISMHYATANPKARTLAKKFEEENREFLAKLFHDDGKNFLELHQEMSDRSTDEVVVAKIADYIEPSHYKFYINQLTKSNLEMIRIKMYEMAHRAKDTTTQKNLKTFISEWIKDLPEGDVQTAILNA